MQDKHPKALPDDIAQTDSAHQLATLATICWMLAWYTSTLAFVFVWDNPSSPHTWLSLVFACLSWVAIILVRKGMHGVVPTLLVSAALLMATLSILAGGTVRVSGSYLLFAAAAGAGVFLGYRAFIATMWYSVSVLGLLTMTEARDLLPAPDFTPSSEGWLFQASVLVFVAMLVFYTRQREKKAIQNQTLELEQRRQSERERDRSTDRFTRIFRTSPNPMLAQSAADGSIVAVNPAFERVYGHSQAEVVGRTDEFLWGDLQERKTYLRLLFKERRVHLHPGLAKRADGSCFPALCSSELGDSQNDALVITSVTDVSEEKRREVLLMGLAKGMDSSNARDFFDSLTQHMAQLLKADLVLMGELISARESDQVQTLSVWRGLGHDANFVYSANQKPCERALQQTSLCVIEACAQMHFANATIDGIGDVQTYVGQALINPHGANVGVLNAMWSRPILVTDELRALMSIFASRANAELLRLHRDREIQALNETLGQRVNERTAELQKLNAELDSFAYSVSHDLKSPLRSIDGFTQLLTESLDGRMSEREADMLRRVVGATGRMSELITDMLSLARISQGPLQRQWVDLSEMAHGIRRLAQERQPTRQVEWDITPNLRSWCDAQLFTIALENLLHNALKYTRDQPHPRIHFGPTEPTANGEPRFCVSDNGTGFDMRYVDKLFKPFQRLHMPSSNFEGSGIGLATVRRVVERHGGEISGHGTPGQGATFVFSLGAQDAPPVGDASTSVRQANPDD